jgi:hypothetical protein
MAYQHRAYKSTCGACQQTFLWNWQSWKHKTVLPPSWECTSCGASNFIGGANPGPNVPRALSIGHDGKRQVEIYPVPPRLSSEPWALPYSIRSFVSQISLQLAGCFYACSRQDVIMDEAVFLDECRDPYAASGEDWHKCHMLTGWTLGQAECGLWNILKTLCKTGAESQFLHDYFALVKGRNFPALIPRPMVDSNEGSRPAFSLYLPLQHFNYKWYAIELNGSRTDSFAYNEDRKLELSSLGYEILSCRTGANGGYGEAVVRLIEKIETEMTEADRNPWGVAIEVLVENTGRPGAEEGDLDQPL